MIPEVEVFRHPKRYVVVARRSPFDASAKFEIIGRYRTLREARVGVRSVSLGREARILEPRSTEKAQGESEAP